MTAKEYLSQLLNLERLISAKSLECERLDAMAKKVTNVLSDCKVDSSHDEGKQADIVIRVIELKKDIEKQLREYTDLQSKISEEINDVADIRHRSILIMRYINGLSFTQIADVMHYGKRWTLVLHRKALEAFDRVHKEKYCA